MRVATPHLIAATEQKRMSYVNDCVAEAGYNLLLGGCAMAYLTCIGSHGSNRNNQGGFGSRGYWVFRRGSSVVARWGAVQPKRGRIVRVRWIYFQETVYRCGSPAKAAKRLRSLVLKMQLPHQGYSLLPRGQRILPPLP